MSKPRKSYQVRQTEPKQKYDLEFYAECGSEHQEKCPHLRTRTYMESARLPALICEDCGLVWKMRKPDGA